MKAIDRRTLVFRERYGPWAVVAGASEGIGAAFSEALAEKGINLILIARRAEKLSEQAERIKSKHKVKIQECVLDLNDLSQVQAFVETLESEIGLFVYNAAYSPIGYFKDLDLLDLQKIISVNIQTPLYLIKSLSQPMLERERGGIIVMSSLSGTQGSPKIATYAASKSFNTILAEGLWHELKEQNVDVLSCIAGAVRTPGYMNSAKQKDAPGTLDPDQVAKEALEALGKGPSVIPGSFNKFAQFVMSRLLSRKRAVQIMHNNTKDLQ